MAIRLSKEERSSLVKLCNDGEQLRKSILKRKGAPKCDLMEKGEKKRTYALKFDTQEVVDKWNYDLEQAIDLIATIKAELTGFFIGNIFKIIGKIGKPSRMESYIKEIFIQLHSRNKLPKIELNWQYEFVSVIEYYWSAHPRGKKHLKFSTYVEVFDGAGNSVFLSKKTTDTRRLDDSSKTHNDSYIRLARELTAGDDTVIYFSYN